MPKTSEKSLDELLQDIEVGDVDKEHRQLNKASAPVGWHYVANDEGVIAYFRDEVDAFNFRLAYINRMMNP